MYIKNLIEYFEKTVSENPEKTAVISGEQSISFEQLRTSALLFASDIAEKSNAVKCPIAVFLEKSIECVIADLGIIYSGNAYMNLDVKTPMQRIGNVLELVNPLFVVTSLKYADFFEQIWPKEKLLFVESIETEIYEQNEKRILRQLHYIIDTDPLCLINTSGSTGTPKSVVLNHRSFIDFTEWALNTFEFSDDEIIGSLSPVVFDIYSFELCMLMAKASTIVLIPGKLAAFPAKLLQVLQEQKVSFIFWVPTIMVNIANLDLFSKFDLPALKMVWFAGEVFPTTQFNYWYRNLPNAKFVNLYGPIEITLDCTYYVVDKEFPESEPLPIGYPCRNTDVLILTEENQPANINEEGELCVRGSSLALGYYNNPEKTSFAFVQNPLNTSYPEVIYRTGDVVLQNEQGLIMFKGRKDSLVKHSGYRVELGEIEHVIINILQIVKNGCAVYDYTKKEIVFFYESQEEISQGDFRKRLGTHLPKYMIPNRFEYMNELPRNTNGKIDRLRLKESV